jgi:membrane-bound serine protease (ClpP class)
MPVNVELEQLRGKIGRAMSALRPGGVTDFDGKRIDTITEGMMVEPGEWVRCIDVRAGKVIVRPIPAPDLGKLENLQFD